MMQQSPPVAPAGIDCSALVGYATLGAVVGASAAGGANILRVQREELTATEALADTGKAALAGAAATAVAGAAAGVVAKEGVTRLAVLLAASTVVMYGIQRRWGADALPEDQP
jgi:hypothetical protein